VTDPRVVILVPRRAGVSRERDITWAWVRSWWWRTFPDWQLFEGHHDEGPFNRSAAINRAAGLADFEQPAPWEVAVIIDADVIVGSPELVRQAVATAQLTGRMVLPFSVRYDLTAQASQRLMAGGEPGMAGVHRTYTDMCSSVNVLTRELWEAVQGYDESFVGWGFEDNAFAAACHTFTGQAELKLDGIVWHLWHPTAPEGKRGTPGHARNRARADRYLAVRGDREATRALRATAAPAYEHHPTGIPRILHRTVPAEPAAQVERWWAAWRKLHPGWELMDHRDPLEPAAWPETSDLWPQCRNGAELADLVRLEALWRWGGIYVDSDVEPWRSLEPLLPLGAFAAWEDERVVPNAVMGAVPQHPAIGRCLELARQRVARPTWDRGPGITTEVLVGRDDVLLLPPGSFYPVHYRDPERAALMASPATRQRNPWAFGLHHYAGSWLEGAQDSAPAALSPLEARRAAREARAYARRAARAAR
jgi:hypothetical protein